MEVQGLTINKGVIHRAKAFCFKPNLQNHGRLSLVLNLFLLQLVWTHTSPGHLPHRNMWQLSDPDVLLVCTIIWFADVTSVATKKGGSSTTLSPQLLATISLTADAELGGPHFFWQSSLEKPFLFQSEEMAGLAKWSELYVGLGEGGWDISHHAGPSAHTMLGWLYQCLGPSFPSDTVQAATKTQLCINRK